jgi:hypothetical protein
MKFLKEFSNWNPKLNKQVLDFIEQNKKYFVTNFFDMKKSEDENMKDLIDHLTKYPELMNTEIDIDNVKSPLRVNTIKNMAPIVMNIGGVKDFKSK